MSEPAEQEPRRQDGGRARVRGSSELASASGGPALSHYFFEKARALQQGGNLAQAEEIYRQLLERDPRAFKVLNNLGIVFESQGRMVEAEWAYRRALEIEPRSALAHFNLGHAMHREGRYEQAEQSYRRASELDPQSFGASFNLGRLLQERERVVEAEACFRRAAEIDPRSTAAHSCLGEALYDQGRVKEALDGYRRAVECDPNTASEHFNVGKALDALGRLEGAAASYRRSLELHPESGVVRANLARALDRLGRRDEAILVIDQWLMLEPLNPVAEHLLAALLGRVVPERASDAYVRETFDRFAAEFDSTLARLDYRAPALIAGALATVCPACLRSLDILDAGCGTGLCGPLLRPFARTLVGVDLSEGMLARARQRGEYDELIAAEIVAFMAMRPEAFDVIVSADTLVYFGALEPVLAAAAQAMRPGGHFIFTLEDSQNEDEGATYRLNPTGRYAHSQRYLRRALEAAGFQPRTIERAELRREAGEPVAGLVAVTVRGD